MTTTDHASGWAAEQLTAFLAAVAELDSPDAAMTSAVERAAEAVDAEVGAIVSDDGVHATVGFPRGHVPVHELYAVVAAGSGTGQLPGVGACVTLVVPFDGAPGGRLLVARAGTEAFSLVERNLLRGMAKTLTLSLRGLRTIGTLRERQTLLERLTRIQRSISARTPLADVLQSIVTGAAELLGDDVVGLRRVDPTDRQYMEMTCSTGLDTDLAQLTRRSKVGEGAGGRAFSEERLVILDSYAAADAALPEFVAIGLQAAMAAPVHEDGLVVGSLVVASKTPGRVYTPAEQEILLAFADHTSLALTDARTVQALRDALARARHDAMHDPLTELPNRALLRDRLERALKRSFRRRTRVALLFLDLDGFKRVNDGLGHDAGDELLVRVAERLQTCIREVDTLARLGGDEFALLLEDVIDETPATEIADRVLAALDEPFLINFREINLTASIGIALSGSPDDGARELLRNADLAMYQAKAEGKRRHIRFHEGMYDEIVERIEIETALRRALDNSEFVLEYQPIVDLDTGRTTQLEALVRWNHPWRGRVIPADFIPVAESTGLIVPIGDWILDEACQQAATWQSDAAISVSVNLSPSQIGPDLPERVHAALHRSGLEAQLLTLEITESLLMDSEPRTLESLASLRKLGIRLAVDDFGTGYSSLSRLRNLPVDQLKIDRSFIADIADGAGAATLVRGIVSIARGLALTVVAEGVESHEQRQMLRRMGCREAQGFLLGRPADADVTAGRLAQSRPVGAQAGVLPTIPRARSSSEVPETLRG